MVGREGMITGSAERDTETRRGRGLLPSAVDPTGLCWKRLHEAGYWRVSRQLVCWTALIHLSLLVIVGEGPTTSYHADFSVEDHRLSILAPTRWSDWLCLYLWCLLNGKCHVVLSHKSQVWLILWMGRLAICFFIIFRISGYAGRCIIVLVICRDEMIHESIAASQWCMAYIQVYVIV